MNNKKQCSIYLSQEDRDMKKEIEKSLDGARLSHTTIYMRGLIAYLQVKQLKDVKIKD